MSSIESTTVPAWIEAVCPPEFRSEAEGLVAELDARFDHVDDLIRRMCDFVDRVSAHEEDLVTSIEGLGPDAAGELREAISLVVCHASGSDALHLALCRYSRVVDPEVVFALRPTSSERVAS